MNTKFYVTAKFTIKKDKMEESLALMKRLTEETNSKEEGCKDYFYLQNSANDCEFTSYEVWESEAEEAKHWATDHVQTALAALPELLEKMPEITKWKGI
jgi:quinol monooxygenase YgiN